MRLRFLAVLLVALLISGQTLAEKPVAPVIGIGAYSNVGIFANPPNDADQKAMKKIVRVFGRKLKEAAMKAQ